MVSIIYDVIMQAAHYSQIILNSQILPSILKIIPE